MNPPRRFRARLNGRHLTAFLSLLAISGALQASPFATIGSGNDCAYNQALDDQIQAAINDGETDIRLVGGLTYVGAVTLNPDADTRIRGGYASCADAASDQLPATPAAAVIEPKAGQAIAVFISEGATPHVQVSLEYLQLRPASGPVAAGNGLFVSGMLNAAFRHGGIAGFSSNGAGGGILVSGATLRLVDSDISDNVAINGGGIYCNQGTIHLDQDSQVQRNAAVGNAPDGNGGGLFLNKCTLYSEAREVDGFGGPAPQGITDNDANQSGGGIYADESTLRFQGGPLCSQSAPGTCRPHLAYVGLNQAGIAGGGFALVNGSDLQLDFALVISNVAGKRGGGIHASSNSNVTFGALDTLYPDVDRSRCQHVSFCNALIGNRVNPPEAGSGGGVRLEDASFAGVNLEMAGNDSALTRHLAAFGDSSIILRQVRIGRAASELPLSGSQSLLAFAGNSVASLSHSSLFASGADGSMIQIENNASLDLDSSAIIMAGDGATLTRLDAATASGDCNAYAGTWPADPSLNAVAVQPGDFDAMGMPLAGTALIDACADAGILPQDRDLLLRPRLTIRLDPSHPLDIGAMERPLDAIFAGGFED